MAIRYRKEYDSWQVYWNDAAGKRRSKSFKTRAEAMKINALLQATGAGHFGADSTESDSSVVRRTFDELYLEYVCEKQFSKVDLARHQSNCRFFLTKLHGWRLTDITTQDLEEIKTEMCQKWCAATAHDRLSILRTLIYYGIRKGYMPTLIFPRLPAAHYRKVVPPTPEEIQRMYAVAPAHLQRVLIIGSAFGVRIGPCELFRLTWADVDLTRRILRVHGSKKNADAEYREVPIREALLPVFAQWQEEDAQAGTDYLINFKGKPVASIKTAWVTTLKKAGITRYFRPYDLRHAFGSEMVAAGVDIATVASLMGHSSPQMLYKHYLYIMDKQKIRAVEQLPEPPICAARHI